MRKPLIMRGRRQILEITLWVLVFLTASATLLITVPRQIGVYDEGLILTGAFRVLHGEWPSRDFYTQYGPAQFFLLAAIFKLFGMNVLVARIYDSMVVGGIVVLSFTAACQVTKSLVLPTTCALAATLVLVHRSILYPATPCILLIILGGMLLAKRLSGSASLRSYVPISITVAALFLFRYDCAILAIAAFATSFLYLLSVDYRQNRVAGGQAVRLVSGNVLLAATCLSAVIVALLATGILVPALHDILDYNTANYARMRSVPFPGVNEIFADPLKALPVYFPLIAALFAIVVLLAKSSLVQGQAFFAAPQLRRRDASLIVFLSITIFCYAQGLVRTEIIHMLISDVPAIILVALTLDALGEFIAFQRASRLFDYALCALFVVAVMITIRDRNIADVIRAQLSHRATPGPAILANFSVERDVLPAIEFIDGQTDSGDRILSAAGRHDKIFVNDVSFYFVAQRLPGTRWAQYDPGVQTSERVQKEMIADIKRYRVKYIVDNRSWDNVREDNESARSSGVTVLDDYAKASFREVRAFGDIAILERDK